MDDSLLLAGYNDADGGGVVSDSFESLLCATGNFNPPDPSLDPCRVGAADPWYPSGERGQASPGRSGLVSVLVFDGRADGGGEGNESGESAVNDPRWRVGNERIGGRSASGREVDSDPPVLPPNPRFGPRCSEEGSEEMLAIITPRLPDTETCTWK